MGNSKSDSLGEWWTDSTGRGWNKSKDDPSLVHDDDESDTRYWIRQDKHYKCGDDGNWRPLNPNNISLNDAWTHFFGPKPISIIIPVVEGRKNDAEKPRTDLIPVDVMLAVTRVLTIGARKYADRNWEKGMNWSRPYGAILRHVWAWWQGEDLDLETNEHHLAHAICECMFALAFALRKMDKFDDRPISPPKPPESAT